MPLFVFRNFGGITMICDVCKFKNICKIRDFMDAEGRYTMSAINNKINEICSDDLFEVRFCCDVFKEEKYEEKK